MPSLAKLLRRVLTYRKQLQPGLVDQLESFNKHPVSNAVMFACMDSRVILTRMLQSDIGDMFVVRNAGNLVPHSKNFSFESATTEPAALEVGCVKNDIRHVLVCGHSDCKAMAALYAMKDHMEEKGGSPLQQWLRRHAQDTVRKYQLLESLGDGGPIPFQAETPAKTFQAYIDRDDDFQGPDKLSQVNTLQQLQNISSYPMLKERLEKDRVRLNALWFDVYTGNFHMFSREQESFLLINEQSLEHLAEDGESAEYQPIEDTINS